LIHFARLQVQSRNALTVKLTIPKILELDKSDHTPQVRKRCRGKSSRRILCNLVLVHVAQQCSGDQESDPTTPGVYGNNKLRFFSVLLLNPSTESTVKSSVAAFKPLLTFIALGIAKASNNLQLPLLHMFLVSAPQCKLFQTPVPAPKDLESKLTYGSIRGSSWVPNRRTGTGSWHNHL